MGLLSSVKHFGLRLIELSLGLHGIMHIFEFGMAIYEEAYLTASLAAFGATTMILGAVLLGHTHNHIHPHHPTTETEIPSVAEYEDRL